MLQLNVAVYYESLCPDSLRFINEQLKPNWNSFAPYADLILIPFGKSQVSENKEMFNFELN